MDESTRNALLAIIAAITLGTNLLGGLLTFLFTRIDVRDQRRESRELAEKQREDTRKLTELTSDLDHRVHRLSLNLDQRIYRLERTRDLVNGLMKVSYGLRQMRDQGERLNLALERGMAKPELDALVDVISDETLSRIHDDLRTALSDPVWEKTWNESEILSSDANPSSEEANSPSNWTPLELTASDFLRLDQVLKNQFSVTEQMHKRILELWEQATQSQ